MVLSGGFLGRLLGPLLKTGLPLMAHILKPLAKSILVPLWLTAAASATDAAIQKKLYGSRTILLFLSGERDGIIKLVESLEDSGVSIKGVSETVENDVKEQKGGFLGMLAATSGASL